MKPKQLQGEVKRFIDCWDYWDRDYAKGHPYFHYPTGVKDFYNQLFKPEMVTEHFEGWISNEGVFVSEGLMESIVLGKDKEIEYGNSEDGLRYGLYPKTLNDFITNCLQAGIKLRWKK